MIIMAVLGLAIVLAWATKPRPKAMRQPPDIIARAPSGIVGDTQPYEQEAPPIAAPAPADQNLSPSNAAVSFPLNVENDFELMQERYGRDNPFAPLYDLPLKQAPVVTQMADFPELNPVFENAPPPPNFNLTAIAVRNGQGIAIIDGEIYRIGDNAKDYTVASIKPDQVILNGRYGAKVTLRLKQELRGNFESRNNEITNINVMKSQPKENIFIPQRGKNNNYSPGPLPPLPEYSIPGPDDFQSEPLPPSGYHQ